MTTFKTFDVDYVFICDDVRKEDNGKWIYIGVYPSDIVPTEFPATLILRMVFRITPKKANMTVPLEMRMLLDGALVGALNGEINVEKAIGDNFPSPPLALIIAHPGRLEVQMREGSDGEWKVVHSLPVHART